MKKYVMICFMMLFMTVVVGCDKETSDDIVRYDLSPSGTMNEYLEDIVVDDDFDLTYADFDEYFISSYDDILSQEGSYEVYYYGANCSHCLYIKEKILTYASTKEVGEFYFLDSRSAGKSELPEELKGVHYGTPALYKITDGILESFYLGARKE